MEALLVKRAQRGDTDAFIRLMEKHKLPLYKIAKSYLRNEEDIADVMQDTILSAYEHIKELRQVLYFKTWLTRILINQCNRILRGRKNLVPLHEHPELEYQNPDTSIQEFLELLNLLKEPYRIVLYLFYVEEFTIREIAAILDMKENTVKTRLSRGRRCFKKLYLKESCASPNPAAYCPANPGSKK